MPIADGVTIVVGAVQMFELCGYVLQVILLFFLAWQ